MLCIVDILPGCYNYSCNTAQFVRAALLLLNQKYTDIFFIDLLIRFDEKRYTWLHQISKYFYGWIQILYIEKTKGDFVVIYYGVGINCHVDHVDIGTCTNVSHIQCKLKAVLSHRKKSFSVLKSCFDFCFLTKSKTVMDDNDKNTKCLLFNIKTWPQ